MSILAPTRATPAAQPLAVRPRGFGQFTVEVAEWPTRSAAPLRHVAATQDGPRCDCVLFLWTGRCLHAQAYLEQHPEEVPVPAPVLDAACDCWDFTLHGACEHVTLDEPPAPACDCRAYLKHGYCLHLFEAEEAA